MLHINKLLILRKKKKDHAGEDLHYPWDYAFCFLHPSWGFPNSTDILYKLIRNWQAAVQWSEVKLRSRVQLFATLWTVARQAPLSMGFSRQEYWSGCLFLLQGIFPTQDRTWVSLTAGRFFTSWATREAPSWPHLKGITSTSPHLQIQWLWGKGFHMPVFGGHKHLVQAPGKKIRWSLLPWGIPDSLAKASSQWGKVP